MHLIMDGKLMTGVLQNEKLIMICWTIPGENRHEQDYHPLRYQIRRRQAGRLGVSGIVLIAESHISIHTFVERKHVISTCSPVRTLMPRRPLGTSARRCNWATEVSYY